jgi:site-specific DNA recombinase
MKQDAHEKRRLLNFLVSNCLWKDGVLTLKFKQPFDMLSAFIVDIRGQKMPESAKRGDFEKWLRRRDSKQNGEKNQVVHSLLSGNAFG